MRILVIIFLSWAGITNVLAQYSIGIYTGLNNVSISGDKPNNSKYNGKSGGLFGLSIDFKLTDDVLLSFQPGFSNTNASLAFLDDNTNTYKDSIDIEFQTIILPIIFNVISDNKKWYFSSGLEFGLISSSTASIVDTGEAIDLESQTSDYSLSINFGVNYLLSLGKPFLTIGVRYNQGLVNLTNSEDSGSYVPRIKSSGIQFLLGFQYLPNKGE